MIGFKEQELRFNEWLMSVRCLYKFFDIASEFLPFEEMNPIFSSEAKSCILVVLKMVHLLIVMAVSRVDTENRL